MFIDIKLLRISEMFTIIYSVPPNRQLRKPTYRKKRKSTRVPPNRQLRKNMAIKNGTTFVSRRKGS